MLTKLNLGSGKKHKEGYINVDIQESCDLKHDLRNRLPYEGNSIDEIYCNDVIQLFSRREWKFVKNDWVRVLKQGGKMNIICWNFEQVLTNYLTDKDKQSDSWSWWLQVIYAGQHNEYDYFKNGFTWDKLKKELEEEGMGNFEEDRSDPLLINLICYKL